MGRTTSPRTRSTSAPKRTPSTRTKRGSSMAGRKGAPATKDPHTCRRRAENTPTHDETATIVGAKRAPTSVAVATNRGDNLTLDPAAGAGTEQAKMDVEPELDHLGNLPVIRRRPGATFRSITVDIEAAPSEGTARGKDDMEKSPRTGTGTFDNVALPSDTPTPPTTPPVSPQQEETITIFDWDDTLMPTTALTRQGCFDTNVIARLPGWLLYQLQQFEASAINVLEEAAKHSTTVIILTNGSEGWVEQSGGRYLPGLVYAIGELGIPIISAQAAYGQMYPADPTMWKKRAFEDLLADGHHPLNLISIGDMDYERVAAKSVRYKPGIEIKYTKTAKLIEMSSIQLLEEQLVHLADVMLDMCEFQHSADWDLQQPDESSAQPARAPGDEDTAADVAAPGSGTVWSSGIEMRVVDAVEAEAEAVELEDKTDPTTDSVVPM